MSSGFGNPKLGQLLVLAEVILHPSHISFALCSFTFISPWKLPSFCQSLQKFFARCLLERQKGEGWRFEDGKTRQSRGFCAEYVSFMGKNAWLSAGCGFGKAQRQTLVLFWKQNRCFAESACSPCKVGSCHDVGLVCGLSSHELATMHSADAQSCMHTHFCYTYMYTSVCVYL